ncbi:MAG: DUF3526 domain-containing protein, partial [Candidatus Latescibacterota bacterium]
FVLPRVGAYLARQVAPAADRRGVEHEVRRTLEEAAEKEEAYKLTVEPQRLWAAMTGAGGTGPVHWRVLTAGNPSPTLEYYRRAHAYAAPLYLAAAEEAWKTRARRQAGLERQRRIAQAFRLASPAGAFVAAAQAIAGTDASEHRRYLAALQGYRRQLVRFLEEREAFASHAFASLYEPSPEENQVLAATLALEGQLALVRQRAMALPRDSDAFREAMQQGGRLYEQRGAQMMQDKQRWEEYVRQHPQKPTRIDLRGLPVFAPPRFGVAQAAAAAGPVLLGLAVANALLLLAAHATFLRSDVR